MDLSDARFHRKVIPWAKLEAEGVDARKVMKEAQKQRMWILARKAEHRWVNQKLQESRSQ
jgi:hypothetical protein